MKMGCHLLVLCHAEKPVQAGERLGEWRQEENSAVHRVPRKEDRAGQ